MLLHRREMPPPIGRADEVVERHVEPLPHLAEHLLHLVAVGERILPLLLRALRNTFCECSSLPIRKWVVEPCQPAVARDDVGGDLFVGRAQVRPAVHEVDGGRQKRTSSLEPCLRAPAPALLDRDARARPQVSPDRRIRAARSSTRPSRRATLNRTGPTGVATVHHLAVQALARHLLVAHADGRRLAEDDVGQRARAARAAPTIVISVPGRFFFICTGE